MNQPKIALMGLDNAGKTSIVRVLSREFENISNLSPTTGIERHYLELLDTKIMIWDYGGQKYYREQFLKSSKINLSQTDVLLYVIDILDSERYEESLDYLKHIFQRLFENNHQFHFGILFHKFDNIEDTTFRDYMKNLLHEIVKMLGKSPIPIEFRKTTINNPLSIIDSISKMIFKFEGFTNPISNSLTIFANKWNLSSIHLYASKKIELGSYSVKKPPTSEVKKELLAFIKKYDTILDVVFKLEKEIRQETYHFTKFYLNTGNIPNPIYLVWCSKVSMSKKFENGLFSLKESIKTLLSNININQPMLN
ncbi:hypothetical protein NEF87_000607 [Candidatus Lokiarchaeum ossiferum]|uniref:GTP-binding protein n=1 Tax=Candidatus Lokiarchaeum ossiferum TaxID=2951803 RepID=A0ABY6HN69_9ARCH|nr:hypothetical protein NEF87_000607 [Candidatus Lokiarchaeum sp. B-35]